MKFLFGVLLMLFACSEEGPDGPTLEEEALEIVADNAYTDSFVRVTDLPPPPSAISAGTFIHLWVHQDNVQTYQDISDGMPVPGVPAGFAVVREVYDDELVLQGTTLMVKQESGYYEDGGNYFYAETDADGIPIEVNGELQTGKLENCTVCHSQRSENLWFFGNPENAFVH